MFNGLLLSGTNEVSFDQKGRMAVPARYRDVICDESENHLIVTRSLFDRCLWIYPADEWDSVVSSLGELPTISDPLCRTIKRVILGSAVDCTMDSQSRILIPQELREAADLDKRAYLIGFNNKFELWSEASYKAQLKADEELLSSACQQMDKHPLLGSIKL